MLFRASILLLSGCLQWCLQGCLQVSAQPAPVVTTPLGRIKGRYVGTRDGRTVMAFLGVPYAKPPVGPLRFQPPQPVDPWPHERLAVVQPRACPYLLDPTSNEDCLYLNVYTPDKDARPLLPVIVYIYGSFFENFGIYSYTHEFFLDEEVILVLVQSRLGLLGYLSTGDEVVPGNMGLKDMRQGLRWVRDNIRYFGGDPEKVTLFGESSGAVSVHYLMQFCEHEGLFRAAITQSGSALTSWGFHPPEEVKKSVVVLAELSGCPSDSQGLVDCLMTRPPEQIVPLYTVLYKNVMYADYDLLLFDLLPLIGGVIEPECVEDRLVTGNPWDQNTTVPWMVGVNSKESLLLFVGEENDKTQATFLYLTATFDFYFPLFLNYVNSKANGTKAAVEAYEFYLKGQPITRATLDEFINLFSDAFFIYPVFEGILRAVNRDSVYVSIFDHVGPREFFPVPPDSRIGPSHADDVFYYFPHPRIPLPIDQPEDNFLPEEIYLSKTIVRRIVNFATCLDPTPGDTCEVQWEPFFPEHKYLHIGQTEVKMEAPFLPERMAFWQAQEFPYKDDDFVSPPCANGTYLN